MKITKLLRDAQKQSSCNSNSLVEAYKTIFGLFSNPDHFSFYLNEELKEIRAQAHFKHGDDELNALEQIVADLSKLNTLLETSQVRNKYGELTHFKRELSKNLTEYTLQYQCARKRAEVSTNPAKQEQKNIEEVVKSAIYLSDSLEKEKYVENMLAILSIQLANTREGIKFFNEEYADKINEKKYDRKDLFLPHIDSWTDFIRGADFEATPINFSLDFRDRKITNQGATIGSYNVRLVMKKRTRNDINYSVQDMLKFESEIFALKNLERTDYNLLKTENKGKFERIRNSEFLSELEKILRLLSHSFEQRLPRQDVSRRLSQQTKMKYDDVLNPDTDYFKLNGENYELYVGVKAKGKADDHSVCVSLEYKKL